ncbi:MAG: hypothetical protein HRT63_07060 [Erythrobacter sp.]|nr:hypothetical protein [Erythrobacter sp.]
MVTLKRLAIVALAYAGAVLAVALGFVGYALILSEGRDLLDPREIGFGLAVFGLFAATYALPVAVPVIAVTEWRRNGTFRVFLAAGAILGIVLAALFTEVPFTRVNWPLAAVMVTCAIGGSLIYWLVAWCWLPPATSQRSKE